MPSIENSRPAPVLLSVVIAVYNGCATLARALESIRRQKLAEVEVVVVDGASTDGTPQVIARHADVVDRWISEPDDGIYSAWNKGLHLSRGRWVAFLGADDVYAPNALSAYLEAIRNAAPETEFISSRVRFRPTFGQPFEIGEAWQWQRCRRHMRVAHVGAAHRRALYERLGTYDETYRICGDYELLLRARDGLRAEFFPLVTADMGGEGISNNQLGRTYAETCRAKWQSGGRSRWQCEVERRWDHFRAIVKRRLARYAPGG